MAVRVGIGYDIHRLMEGRTFILGGIEIPYGLGLYGHSDGDVLIHAIIDALLGAIGKGDIGEHFPDSDPRYEGVSSVIFLKKIGAHVKKAGYRIGNIDAVVIAQEPHLSGFKKQIREKIAGVLSVSVNKVGIKAKTNEGLGELGEKLAIAVYAVVALEGGKK
ncbi:MAG: 2-C-methyl-D-erythritol 2,4-cyclodiphosphate synthase [Candidatus Omnitrophica bacterium]|nr:2-C-methyl-D-erythritol 2,4-cyclodiphosphate synthase [Candidatus Omnitrophota bacterium]